MNKNELMLAGVMRRLFKMRFILRSTNEHWFQVIADQQEKIREILANFGAELEFNPTLGIAYVRALSEELEEMIDYQLGTIRTLGRYTSILLIYLRQRRLAFFDNPGNEERALARMEEIREYLHEFNFHKKDSDFQKEFKNALNDLQDLRVITRFNQDELFEITPVCDVLLPADKVQDLLLRAKDYIKLKNLDTSDKDLTDMPEDNMHA